LNGINLVSNFGLIYFQWIFKILFELTDEGGVKLFKENVVMAT